MSSNPVEIGDEIIDIETFDEYKVTCVGDFIYYEGIEGSGSVRADSFYDYFNIVNKD